VYENLCPRCDASLPVESINIQEGVALCPGCGALSRLKEIVDQTRPTGEILSHRPRGCTIEEGDQEIFVAPEMEGGDSLGMTLFLCVFLTPFVTIGAFLIATVLTTAFGAVQAVIREELVLIRTGIGRIAWTKRFDPRQFRQLTTTTTTKWQKNNEPTEVIEVIADETVQFGSMLARERREWMAAVLKEMLSKPRSEWRSELWNPSEAG